MSSEPGRQVPHGLLLVQGGCLPEQLRLFLESSRVTEAAGAPDMPVETIQFLVLPAPAVHTALNQVCSELDVLDHIHPT